MDVERFATEICPRHFKSCVYSSIVRQLNMYHFHPRQPYSSRQKNEKHFIHPLFKKDGERMLCNIQKRLKGCTELKKYGSFGKALMDPVVGGYDLHGEESMI